MARKRPAFQFYPGDYLRDPVACCSHEAQCLWLRMLFVMHDRTPYGHLAFDGKAMPPVAIAKACGFTIDDYQRVLQELDAAGVPRRTANGVIYSKRMVEDQQERDADAERKAKGRKSPVDVRQKSADCPPKVRSMSAGKEGEGEEEEPSFLPTSTHNTHLPVSSDLPADRVRAGFEEGRKAGPASVDEWCRLRRINGAMRSHLLDVPGVTVAALDAAASDAKASGATNPPAAACWRVCDALGRPPPKAAKGRMSAEFLKLQQIVHSRTKRAGGLS